MRRKVVEFTRSAYGHLVLLDLVRLNERLSIESSSLGHIYHGGRSRSIFKGCDCAVLTGLFSKTALVVLLVPVHGSR